MGHVQKNEVLAKFMENGEWDFHHVEAFPHSPEVEQHPTNSSAQGYHIIRVFIMSFVTYYMLNIFYKDGIRRKIKD